MLSGLLNVTIHSLNGLEQPCGEYVSMSHTVRLALTVTCCKQPI